jgi:tRNA (guanine37-N1)-methyltransferase
MGIDLIGSEDKTVALVELRRATKKKLKEVVEKIRRHNKNVKSIVKKVHGTRGKFRLRKNELIWGNKNTEVVHKEYGYFLKLNPLDVYFSPRESTIRQYVCKKIRPKENILVMFAGIGPYAICIAKKQPRVKQIVAVEINPKAARYLGENVSLNKVSHLVIPIQGHVKICEDLPGKFDRVIMPMVKSLDYLPLAARCSKKNGTIHLYTISKEKNNFGDCEKLVASIMKKIKKRYEVKDIRKISLYAPRKWKVLMEIKLK